MKIFIIPFLLVLSLWGVDMQKLKEYKQRQKATPPSEKNRGKKLSLTIIFEKEQNDVSKIESNYPLKLQKCLIQRVCIFTLLDTNDITPLIARLKRENSTIQSVQISQKNHFQKL